MLFPSFYICKMVSYCFEFAQTVEYIRCSFQQYKIGRWKIFFEIRPMFNKYHWLVAIFNSVTSYIDSDKHWETLKT